MIQRMLGKAKEILTEELLMKLYGLEVEVREQLLIPKLYS